MSKNLSMTSIKKEHNKQFKETKRVDLSNGSHIDIQLKFKPTSIQRLLLDFQDILEQLKQKKVDWNVTQNVMFAHYLLLIKHFSSADNIPNDVDQMIIVCEQLHDLGVLEEILSAFPSEELAKVDELIEKVSKNSEFIGDQIGELLVRDAIRAQEESKEVNG